MQDVKEKKISNEDINIYENEIITNIGKCNIKEQIYYDPYLLSDPET